MNMTSSRETKAMVEQNTNTCNATKAAVVKVEEKQTSMEKKVDNLARRLTLVEGGPTKGASKGAAKGGGRPVVHNLSPRGVDPFLTNDPWGEARGNWGAGLGFAPAPRQAQETGEEWAAYANNVGTASAARPDYKLATRPGDRTGLIFGGFDNDSDGDDIERKLRTIMQGIEGVVNIKALGKFSVAGKGDLRDQRSHVGLYQSTQGS
jgi:hypothetical protein